MSRPALPVKTGAPLAGLDAVRFLAAVLVMFYHLCFWRNGELPPVENHAARALWFGWIGVPVFFVLSGIVIAFSARHSTPAGFAQNRLLRLVPGVWICATLSLALGLALAQPADPLLPARYLQTMVLLPVGNHIDVVYWTLTVEVAFYALVFLLLRFRGFSAVLPAMLAVGLVSAAYEGTRILQDTGQAGALPDFWVAAVAAVARKTAARLLLLPHGIFFSLGVIIAAWPQSRRPFLLGAAAVFFAGVCFLDVHHEAGRYLRRNDLAGVSPLWPALVWLGATAAMVVSLATHRLVRGWSARWGAALRFLGLLTFPLYLLHNTNGLLLERFLAARGAGPAAAFWLAVGVVVALAAAVTGWIEPRLRRSLQDFIRRGLAQRAAPPVAGAARAGL